MLFISKNFVDGRIVPFIFTCTGQNTICLKAFSNLLHGISIKGFSVYTFDDFGLFWINNKFAIWTFGIS